MKPPAYNGECVKCGQAICKCEAKPASSEQTEADRARDEFIASKNIDRCFECGYHAVATLEETWDAALAWAKKRGEL